MYDARFGRISGMITFASRDGSNAFLGSLFHPARARCIRRCIAWSKQAGFVRSGLLPTITGGRGIVKLQPLNAAGSPAKKGSGGVRLMRSHEC
jgi:hypothetical protein